MIAANAIAYGAQQKVGELIEFLDLVGELNADVIVEIGVHAGGSLYAWKQLASTVIGIDEMPSGPDPIYCISGQPRNDHGAQMIIGDSHDEATRDELLDCLAGRMIDCLFIDGDHRYDGVRADYEMYRQLVRSGGLIAFHDICAIGVNDIDVKQFWDEIKDESAFEIIDPVEPVDIGFGIGVLCVS